MDKTIDNWARRLFYLGIAVVMILGLLLAPAVTSQANAADVSAKWSKVATPTTDDGKVLPGSDLNFYGTSIGGTVVYVVGTGPDLDDLNDDGDKTEIVNQIWKSDDSGATWRAITKALIDVVKDKGLGNATQFCNTGISSLDNVVVPMADASGEYVAVAATVNGTARVFVSFDGGSTFGWPGRITADDANITILRMDISGEIDGKRNIAVGGIDSSGEALLYRLETGGNWGSWEDATLYLGWDNTTGNVDINSTAVTDIKFPLTWAADKTVVVVSHNATATFLQTGVWSTNNRWNYEAGLDYAVKIVDDPSILPILAKQTCAVSGLALPTDYDKDNRIVWVYVDVANATKASPSFAAGRHGIIFRVENDVSVPITMQIAGMPLLASIFYLGPIDSGKAIAGLLGDGTLTEVDTYGVYMPTLTECGKGVQVYRNDNIAGMTICCEQWTKACKLPTGNLAAQVAYVSASKAYAVGTSLGSVLPGMLVADESAFSVSFDDGKNWNQLGLVDTYIDYLSDVAKSPNCNKTWVVSVNNETMHETLLRESQVEQVCECDSVWLLGEIEAPEYSDTWMRVWSGNLTGNEGLLRLAPEETDEALTVYLVDRYTKIVYWETTEGLGCWNKGSAAPFEISDLAVTNFETIYAVGFDGYVANSTDYADDWGKKVDSGLNTGHTIVVTPTTDTATADILVGGEEGGVAYSSDGGTTFTELKDGLGSGNVHVAFDSYFDTNSKVYAAVSVVNATEYPVNDPDNGIYRWVIDESSSWTDLGECAGAATPYAAQLGYDTCNETQVGYYGIILSNAEGNPETDAITGGVLYATFYDEDGNVTGVARCLNPAEEVACGGQSWDYLIQGMAEDAAFTLEPSSLKICGCLTPDTNARLWAIDDHPYYADLANGTAEDDNVGRLWTYEDCFAKAGPTLNSPADNAVVDADPCYCWNDAFTLKWERQCDACSYNLQISRDADFTEVVLDISGKDGDCLEYDYEPPSGTSPSYVVANGALGTGSCGTTFYWRVRSADAETDEIIHSWWSEVRSFTVATGPGAAVTLTNPSNGAIGVAVTGIPFTWDAVADATGYEFSMVKADGTDVVSATAVSGTTYTYTGTLSYNTSYYWTVKALKDSVVFGQATATFTTGAEKAVPPAPTTASWLWVIIGIGAVVWLVILVLIFRTRRV